MSSYSNDPTTLIEYSEKVSMEYSVPLIYPYDLGANGESKAVSFFVTEYDKYAIGRQEKNSRILSRMYLPVPPELSAGDSLEYEEFSAPLLQNLTVGVKALFDGRGREATSSILSGVANVADKLFGQDARYAQSLVGATVNPRNTNLFKTPKAREYQFVYRFIATNIAESDRINELINRFRYHAYPDVNPGEGIFYVPDIFLISVKQLQNGIWVDNDYMFKPLPCALVAMNVQYNGDSPVAFFKETGAPVEVTLTLNFIEMELDNKQELAKRYYSKKDVSSFSKNYAQQNATVAGAVNPMNQGNGNFRGNGASGTW